MIIVMLFRKYCSYTVYLLENLIHKEIACVSPKLFNDPLDSYYLMDDTLLDRFSNIYPKEVRVACLNLSEKTDDSLSKSEMLMWAHYADAHKGISIEYEILGKEFKNSPDTVSDIRESCFLNKIHYMPKFLNKLKNLDLSMGDNEQNLHTLFLTKDEAFSYEKEYRILKYSISEKDIDFISAPRVSKIIFGLRCSNELEKVISKINEKVYSNKIELYKIDKDFKEVLL